ncbi:MAG TPA: hypothetical protein PLP42_14670 [Acidobacteriota bacterium]|nr:hypothetical protein [Acidobacteriota bacterium]
MPNAFALVHERPSVAGTAITPFSVEIVYRAGDQVDTVLIWDSKGKHSVKVEQVSEDQLLLCRGGGDLPGPFTEKPDGEVDARELIVREAEGIGFSTSFSVEEALQNALADAANKLGTPPNPDSLLTAEVVSIRTQMGGIAGLRQLSVHVIASLVV